MLRRGFLSSKICSTTNVRQLITSCVKSNEPNTYKSVNSHETEKADIYSANHEQNEMDEPQHDYIHTTNFQRMILSVGSSVAALVNPRR